MNIYEIVESAGWKKFSDKLELYSVILFGVAVLLLGFKDSENNMSDVLFTTSIGTLSVTSFFRGFQKLDSEILILKKYFYKLYGFAIALGFMTILFIIQDGPSPTESMAVISLVLILTALVLGIRERKKDNYTIDWRFFTRIGLTALPLMGFLLVRLYVLVMSAIG